MIDFVQRLIRWRWSVVVGSLLVCGLSGIGLGKLQFLGDYRYIFTEDNPFLLAFDEVEGTYTKNDILTLVVHVEEGDLFQADRLSMLRKLTDRAWQVPLSIRVDSPTNYQYSQADGDDLYVGDFVEDPESLSSDDLERLRRIATTDPSIVHRLVSEDARAAGIHITIQTPTGAQDVMRAATLYCRDLLAKFRDRHPDVRFGLTGNLALTNAFLEASQLDLQRLVPAMYTVLILTMAVFLRSVLGTLATLGIAGMSTVTAMGLAGWLGIPLTALTASAPTIILTVAVADSVHLLVSATTAMRHGSDKGEAIVESVRINAQPVFLTSLTTMIGFLSLNFSDSPPFRDLGNVTAIGVCAAWVYSIVFLPALISIVPFGPRRRVGELDRAPMERYADWLIRRHGSVLWVCAALVTLSILLIPRIQINDAFVEFFSEEIEFRRDTDLASEVLTGIYQIHYSIDSGEAAGVSNPEYLETLERFAAWFRTQPEVVHVQTLSDVIKRLNRNLHGDAPDWYRLTDDREAAAQYLLLYEMSLPYGLDLNNQIDVQKRSTRFSVTVDNLSTAQLLELNQRGENWLRENTTESSWADGVGTALVFAHISERNLRGMTTGTTLAFFLISISLAFAFRSIRYGVLSLVPNLAPSVIAFGVWALVIREAGVAVTTVSACSLGIVVDATVHFLSKYLRARGEQRLDVVDAVRYALRTVGGALWVTFLVLGCGFAVLAFSSFKMNADFGKLVALTIGAAMVSAFLLLPALLLELDSSGRVKKPAS